MGKQLALLGALVEGKGIGEAAASAGIDLREAYRIASRVSFRERLLRHLKPTIDVAVTRTVLMWPHAVAALSSLTRFEAAHGATEEAVVAAAEVRRRASTVLLKAGLEVMKSHPAFKLPEPTPAGHGPMFMLPPGARVAVLVDGRDAPPPGNGGNGHGEALPSWSEAAVDPPTQSAPVQAVYDAEPIQQARADAAVEPGTQGATFGSELMVDVVVAQPTVEPAVEDPAAYSGEEHVESEPVFEERAVARVEPEVSERPPAPGEQVPSPESLAWDLASPGVLDVFVPGFDVPPRKTKPRL